MKPLINILTENQYFKISAESLLNELEPKEMSNILSKLYNLNEIVAISRERYDSSIKLFKVIFKLPNLHFTIRTTHERTISKVSRKTGLNEYILTLCEGLAQEEVEEVESYIEDTYDKKCREATIKGILEIPVIINQPLYLASSFTVKDDGKIYDLSTHLNFNFHSQYSKNENEFGVRNGLHLPNQYDSGKLCLGENQTYPENINEKNLKEDLVIYTEGRFNGDMLDIPVYSTSLVEYILDTIKDFAIKNQFSSDLQKNKVAKLLIKQLKKEEIKTSLNEFFNVDEYINRNYEDFFRNNYSLYLLLSIFH